MANYTKLTDFASKDTLPTGSPAKIVKGTEIDDELNSVEIAIATKANTDSPSLTGIPTVPTAATGTNTSQVASTQFVTSAINAIPEYDLTPYAKVTDANQNITANTVVMEGWTLNGAGGYLYFAYNGNNVFRLDSSGNLVVEGNVTAYQGV